MAGTAGNTLEGDLAGIADAGLQRVLAAVAGATADIAEVLRWSSDTGKAGGQNSSGDSQLTADVVSDEAVWSRLRGSGAVELAASEEQIGEKELGGSGFSVAFDPLDGSSVYDANFAVGSIYGIWPGKGLVGRTGFEQVAAAYGLYGPRTVLVVATKWTASCTSPSVREYTLTASGQYKRTREDIRIEGEAKHFAPANLRGAVDNPTYRAVVNSWVDSKLTLRYSGAMVPDVHHMLTKGQGVFCSPDASSAPAKLRAAYEVFPLAYIIEAAGGASSDGRGSALARTLQTTDDRCPICLGSVEEVERASEAMEGIVTTQPAATGTPA